MAAAVIAIAAAAPVLPAPAQANSPHSDPASRSVQLAQLSAERAFDIAAQPLTTALTAFGQQSGLQVSVHGALPRGRAAPAVRGTMTNQEALARLLAGSGLTWQSVDANTVTVQAAMAEPLLVDAIIVQGERSGRPLRETPASTMVLSGEEVDRPQNLNIRDIADQVPNVIFDDTPFLPSVRGVDGSSEQVGAIAFTSGAQPRVNVLVDGVARPVNNGGAGPAITSLWDTEQVEVARGPQSTLGGRNSLAGNIRVLTNDPVYSVEGAARAFAFNEQGTIGGALMMNAPIVDDQMAVRVTVEASDGESYLDVTNPAFGDAVDDIEDEEFRRYRAKVLLTPAALPDLSILASAERTESFGLLAAIAEVGSFDLADSTGLVSTNDNTTNVFSLQGNYALNENIEIEVRGSYIDNEYLLPLLSPVPLFNVVSDTESLVAEALVRFEDIGRINRGVFGVIYEQQTETTENFSPILPLFADGTIESIGVFGEVESAITDRLSLITGARVELDDRDRTFEASGEGDSLDVQETAFIPRVGLRYDLLDDVTIGYQYSEGFRPGGLTFDTRAPAGSVAIYDSERIRQHEIYTRSSFLGGRANFNASAFFYTFNDVQASGAGGVGPTGTPLFGNLPSARGFGTEFEGSYSFSNGLTLSAGLGLLETEITDAGSIVPELQGKELPRAPNVNASVGLSYVSDFGLDASARLTHVGPAANRLDTGEQPAYTTIDLAIGYEVDIAGAGPVFRIDAFVNNATDDRIVLGPFGFGPGEQVGRPRTVGIAATVRF